ncbi:class B sortase [Hydrogenoanaerobacterium sp.]|uniref:class B sortase n=1 Tax=Hydrogenoanaerobacterium sp. TaxID=2953763 RepID=UPI0028A226D4|nr:class B sortase [Hydrogenoanaerobacterium sp.]
MRKVLVSILVVVVVAGLAVGGYLLMGNLPTSAEQPAEPASVVFADVRGPMLPTGSQADTSFYEVTLALQHATSQNEDTVGWLQIPNTDINNSVLQSNNNMYYLRRNEKKEDDIYGCYFTDYASEFESRDALSANTVIYGHSDLKDNPEGPRFSQLFRFTQKEFAEKNRTVYFSIDGEQMQWQIFAAFYTDLDFNYITPDMDSGALIAMANEAKVRSLYDYGVSVYPNDKVLTLSTCSVKYGDRRDQRFVLMAKLLPADGAPEQAVELKENPSPKQPVFASAT